jgi:hypothetical protein
VLAFLLTLVSATAGDAEVHWRGGRHAPAELPAECPVAARQAAEAWTAWAGANDYRMDLDPAGRVLLISRAGNSQLDNQLILCTRVVELFDQELPPPALRLAPKPLVLEPEAPPEPVVRPDTVPEDPEDPGGEDHPWTLEPTKPRPADRTSAEPKVTVWGAQDAPLDTETAVMLVVHDHVDLQAVLEHLSSTYAYLEGWAEKAGQQQGFVVGNPLVGAYVENFSGQEEWDPQHELVSRLARLLMLRRFGQQPIWVSYGYAWHIEQKLFQSVYCFPWRDEFVYAVEHSAWPREVRNRYQTRHLAARDFLTWRPGKYVSEKAQAGWAFVEYLVARRHDELPALLEELRVKHLDDSRVKDGPSSWRRDVDYVIPVSQQEDLLEKHLGKAAMTDATNFARHELGK